MNNLHSYPVSFRALVRKYDDGAAPLYGEAELAFASKPKNVRWSSSGADWPRAGGRDFIRASRDAFLSPEFLTRYRPGFERLVYVATCPGLRRVAGEIQMPTSKISSCRPGRLQARLQEQSADGYGAAVLRDGDLIIEPGWNEWDAVLLRPNEGPSRGSPVTVGPRSMNVVLPAGMLPEDFDKLWDAETRLAAIDVWARSETGGAHLSKLGVEKSRVERRTIYQIDGRPRVSATRELCVYRKTQDADRLIQIAERIILRSLGL